MSATITCPVCNRHEISLTPNGFIRSHKNFGAGVLVGRKIRVPICAASGRTPEEIKKAVSQ